jgi:NAD+ kinase
MASFTIVTRPDEVSLKLEAQLKQDLKAKGYIEDEACPDTIFVVGGDGTFIFAVHKYLEQLDHARFYGIHTGTLGFYTDFRDCEYEEFLQVFLQGNMNEAVYPLLEAKTDHTVHYGINEIRIENAARTQTMHVLIDGVSWEDFRGTGMCLSTQLGSTAYNRSLGGAVIQEGLPLVELTEISGIHHSKYRSLGAPLIMRDDIEAEFRSEDFKGALLGADSDVFPLDQETFVKVRRCPYKQVHMLRGKNISYFSRLKSLF